MTQSVLSPKLDANAQEEIRNAIKRGTLLINTLASVNVDELLDTVEQVVFACYGQEILDRKDLNIDTEALSLLDSAKPPISYPYYFCTPDILIKYPRLITYYRNIAMLSRKAMSDLGISIEIYEDKGLQLFADEALELSRYFNGIVSALVKKGGVTQHRHIEMMLANMSDLLGGCQAFHGRYDSESLHS